jgi:peptide/nickel transport system permease protein
LGLKAYILRRLILAIPVLFGVSVMVFAVLQLFTPAERAGLYIRHAKELAAIPWIIEKYGLHQPIYVQFYIWLKEVVTGNLGWSKTVSMPVLEALFYFLPATVELALFATPLILLGGIILGTWAATHKDKAIDHGTRAMAIVGCSLPAFWLGLMLLMVFYGYFTGLLPPERLTTQVSIYVNSPQFVRYTHLNSIDAILNREPWVLVDALRHLVLPVVTLTVVNLAFVMRIMRCSMLESLSKGYIVTARAKGLDEGTVIGKHARRNAFMPVLTVTGYLFAGLMNGVILTETIFNYKGVGWWAWQSAINLDIPAVLGFTLFNGTLFVITNLLVDLLYAYTDPRVRLGAGA